MKSDYKKQIIVNNKKLYWHDKNVENFTIKRIFKGLTEYYDYYVKELEIDTPFGYIERSQFGNIVQAAAYKKILTVEEYSVVFKDPKSSNKNFRPDLWIHDPKAKSQSMILFEGKQLWITLDKNKEILKDAIDEQINKAYDQLSSYNKFLKNTKSKSEAHKICCMVFLPIYCAPSKWPQRDNYKDKMQEFSEMFKQCCQKLGRNFVSFSYSYFIDSWEKARKIKSDTGYIYPGILIAGWLRNWNNAF